MHLISQNLEDFLFFLVFIYTDNCKRKLRIRAWIKDISAVAAIRWSSSEWITIGKKKKKEIVPSGRVKCSCLRWLLLFRAIYWLLPCGNRFFSFITLIESRSFNFWLYTLSIPYDFSLKTKSRRRLGHWFRNFPIFTFSYSSFEVIGCVYVFWKLNILETCTNVP